MSQWSSLSATFKTEVKKKGNKPRVGIALSGIAKYYSRGKSFVMNGNTYLDELGSYPSLSISSKMEGGLSSVNKLNVEILNQDLTSDHFAESGLYHDPENTEVKGYLIFDSGTTLLADSIQFFKGIIDGFPEINYKSLKIACSSIDKIIFKKIGNLTTNDDATSGYSLPEDSLGRVKPIIYGDHRFGVNFTEDNSQLASNYSFNRENNVVEAVPLGGGRFLIADHEVNSINSNGDAIWLYDEDLGRLVEVNSYSVVQNTSDGCIISVTGITEVRSASNGSVAALTLWKFSGSSSFVTDGVEVGDKLIIETGNNVGEYDIFSVSASYVYVFPLMGQADTNIDYRIEHYPEFNDWRSPNGASSGDWSNVSRVYDLSIGSASEVSITAVGTKTMKVDFPSTNISSMNIIEAKIYIKGSHTYSGTSDLLLYADSQACYFDPDDPTGYFRPQYSSQSLASINDVYIIFQKFGGDASAFTASIYEVIQKITYRKRIATDKMKIFFGGKGKEYGSWINGRSTGEGFSVTHQDDDNSGDLIENAAGVIESIFRDLLSYSTIDEDSFNISSAGDLSSSKLSFDISEQIESDKLISDILERSKSLGSFNYNDEFKMITYNSTDNFTESGTGTPDDEDIFIFNPTQSGDYSDNTRQFDENPIIEDSFWIRKNPASNIVTNFTVNYYKTHEGGYARTLTDTDTTYITEDISKTFDHPYTKDQTTAQIWLIYLIDRLNRNHWACGFDTWYNAIAKEMWDVVNVQHPILENLVSDYLTKKWRILKLDIDTGLGKISIELEEQ